jgi:hypothetical protein
MPGTASSLPRRSAPSSLELAGAAGAAGAAALAGARPCLLHTACTTCALSCCTSAGSASVAPHAAAPPPPPRVVPQRAKTKVRASVVGKPLAVSACLGVGRRCQGGGQRRPWGASALRAPCAADTGDTPPGQTPPRQHTRAGHGAGPPRRRQLPSPGRPPAAPAAGPAAALAARCATAAAPPAQGCCQGQGHDLHTHAASSTLPPPH